MSEPKWDTARLSSGEKCVLKRNAGVMMCSASMQAIEAFYRAQSKQCKSYEESAWFAALCMQCLWREEDHPSIKLFPEMLQAIYQNPEATDSTRKRCTNFLDLCWADDGFLLGKICNLVRKMKADHPEIMPDFCALADDFIHWNQENHSVQRQWLNTICRTTNEGNEIEEEESHVD